MSRVFDTPRYRHQTLHKILVTLSTLKDGVASCAALFSYGDGYTFDIAESAFILGLCRIDHPQFAYPEEEADLSDGELFSRYAYIEGLMRGDIIYLGQYRRSAELLRDVLHHVTQKKKRVYTDEEATFRIVEGYLSGKYVASRSDRCQRRYGEVAGWTRDIVSASLIANRLGGNVIDKVVKDYKTPNEASVEWTRMINWAESWEKMRFRSFTPEMQDAHEVLRNNGPQPSVANVSGKNTYAGRHLGCVSLHRVIGLFVLEYKDAVYVLDHSAMDQIHQVARSWDGAWGYAANYRRTGMLDSPRDDFESALKATQAWVCASLVESNYSAYLPRSMKQSVALLQNELHTHAEVLQMGSAEKTREMKRAIPLILPLKVYWHEFLLTLPISDRTRLDLANAFYFLPAPDANPSDLFDRAVTCMSATKFADPAMFSRFLAYAMSVDLCKFLCRFKRIPNHKCEDGYTLEDRDWVKRCLKGDFCLPPEAELGKAWIFREFAFINYVPDWFWEASDVTHVCSDRTQFNTLVSSVCVPRIMHNELLYALEHAPALSVKWKPEDVLEYLGTGEDKWDRLGVMASKCENTKPGKKVRETWSADDITRELTSTYDRAGAAIASLHRGVVSRKPPAQVNRMFDRVSELTTRHDKGAILIISDDVSGWSPSGDRTQWERHHNYVVQTTKAPPNLTMSNIWKNIVAAINKRGMFGLHSLPTGLFQGWTGMLDSIMNVHMSQFCVHEGKLRGYLKGGEAATTAGLIDDALQGLELEVPASDPRAQAAADAHFDTTAKVWRSLGAELDVVKTLYSSIKMIFLNRLYCEGSEIMHGMKVCARAGRELKRRHSGIHSQIDTILGSFRSAAEKGSDPMWCYTVAVFKCLDIIHQTAGGRLDNKSNPWKIINSAFAPRSLGGWGIPHYIGWLTKEDQDPLVRYIAVVCSLNQASQFQCPTLVDAMVATLSQEFEIASADCLMADPRTPRAVGVSNPEGIVVRKVSEAMRTYAKSPIFLGAFNVVADETIREKKLEALRACTWDASVLEVLAGCMPESVIQALVDRAYKNDMLSTLIRPADRRRLTEALKKANHSAIMHLMDIHCPSIDEQGYYSRVNIMDIAEGVRDRYYLVNSMVIVNATVPDYGTCFTRRADALAYCVKVEFGGVQSKCADQGAVKGRQYRNLYEGMPTHGKLKGSSSAKPYSFGGEGHKVLSPPQKAFEKASILAAHVKEAGGDGDAIFALCMACWGLLNVQPSSQVAVKPGTSLKRISTKTAHVEHSIGAYTNTAGSVSVDATPLGRYLNEVSTPTDYMSFITAARVIGLTEFACDTPTDTKLIYGVLPGVFPEYIRVGLRVEDEDEFDSAIRTINQRVPAWVAADAEQIMLRVTDPAPGDGETAVVVNTTRGGARRVHDAVMAPGAIAHMFSSGMAPVSAVVQASRKRRVQGDEVIRSNAMSLESRYRRLLAKLEIGDAAAGIFCEQLVVNIGKAPSMAMHSVAWRSAGLSLEAEVPGWRVAFENARAAVINIVGHIPRDMSERLTGSNHFTRVLVIGVGGGETNAAEICAIAWLTAYGRCRTSASYRRAAMIGIHALRRTWNSAATRYASRSAATPAGMFFCIMGSLFREMYYTSAGNPTVVAMLRAIASGLTNGLAMALQRDVPPFPMLAIEHLNEEDNDLRGRYVAACENQLTHLCPALRGQPVVGMLTDVLEDLRCLGIAQSMPDLRPHVTLVDNREQGQAIVLPSIGSTLVIGEDPSGSDEDMGDDLEAAFTREELYVYRVGSTFGAAAAAHYIATGEVPREPEELFDDVTVEEVREWFQLLREGRGFTRGDEIM